MINILVYLESKDQGLKRVSYEIITAARKLTESGDVKITGVLLNGTSAQAKTAEAYGINEIYTVNHSLLSNYSSTAAAQVVGQIATAVKPDIILFSANATGLELAPRVAVKMNAGYVSDCVTLASVDGVIIAKKPVYAGKSIIKTKINTAGYKRSKRLLLKSMK